jgi:hypothetical protein
MPGMKVKRFEQGDRCLRLVEFREDFHEPDFCTKKHLGYVLEGSCAIHFADGRSVTAFPVSPARMTAPGHSMNAASTEASGSGVRWARPRRIWTPLYAPSAANRRPRSM